VMLVSLPPQIRVSAMLLLLSRKLILRALRWPSKVWRSYIVQWSVVSTDEVNSKITGFLQGKLSKIHTFNITMLFVCLSVTFKLLNCVTLLQIRCEYYDDLGGHYNALGFNCRHLVKTKWRTCKVLRCGQYFLQNIFCVLLDRGEL